MAFPTLNVTPGSGQTINTLPDAGQGTSANSLPVVIASDQSAVPVSASSLPLPTGAAQEAGGNLAAVATVAGTPADTAWAGSGNSSIIAALKAIYAEVAGTLTASISGSVAVTGTFWQTTQPVSGTVTANAGSGTFAVSATSLPLPTGAATAANQATAAAQGSATSGQTGPLIQGAVTASGPAYTTGDTNPLSLDTSGNLRVGQPDVRATSQSLAAGTANAAISIALANAESIIGVVVTGLTASGATLTTELSKDGGTTWTAANNTSPGGGVLSTTIAADGSFRMHCAGSTNARLRVSTTGNGTINVSYTVSAAAGIVSLGDPIPSGSNIIGSTSAAANTSGGASVYDAAGGTGNALLTNSAVAVKSSAGNLYGVSFYNGGTVAAYVQIFDLAAGSVTLNTTVPKMTFWVPAGGAWEEKFTGEAKISFVNAITAAATTTATGNTAPATGIKATFLYK
ncbi:MAG TPA: hypothetical protein VME69_06595 [Methylocella sp.]|nr:hypothetical protein [Methylocella sp.]